MSSGFGVRFVCVRYGFDLGFNRKRMLACLSTNQKINDSRKSLTSLFLK